MVASLEKSQTGGGGGGPVLTETARAARLADGGHISKSSAWTWPSASSLSYKTVDTTGYSPQGQHPAPR